MMWGRGVGHGYIRHGWAAETSVQFENFSSTQLLNIFGSAK